MLYEVLPLKLAPERAEIISTILRAIFTHETVFSDYQRGCGECGERLLEEMCERCQSQMALIARTLGDSSSKAWEVWQVGGEVVGIVFFSDIILGGDAKGHYIFFDKQLSDKTSVLKEVMAWAFADHPSENWKALRRITIEIPDHAGALVHHAHKKLGFGGPFRHVLRTRMFKGEEQKTSVRVEGIKENAVLWRGELRDLLILGLQNPSLHQENQMPRNVPSEIAQPL